MFLPVWGTNKSVTMMTKGGWRWRCRLMLSTSSVVWAAYARQSSHTRKWSGVRKPFEGMFVQVTLAQASERFHQQLLVAAAAKCKRSIIFHQFRIDSVTFFVGDPARRPGGSDWVFDEGHLCTGPE